MTDLADWQLELDGLATGPGTDYVLESYDDGGIPEWRTQDSDVPAGDGVRFGVDRLPGRTVKPTFIARGLDAVSTLVRHWLASSVRTIPGAVLPLTLKRPGRDAVRVYGRPRKCAPSYDTSPTGWTSVVADFATADHRYYADAESTLTVPILVGSVGGWSWPLHWPLSVTSPSTHDYVCDVGGELDTYAVGTFVGPGSSPKVELLDSAGGTVWSLALDTALATGQSVTVDPRPWSRTALRTDGANLAGTITRDSARMADLLLSPGDREVRFTGTDPTGTAKITVSWRSAWASL